MDHAHFRLGRPQPEWAAGKQGARATGSVVPTCAEESAHEYRVKELGDQNDATKTGLKDDSTEDPKFGNPEAYLRIS